MMRCIAGWMGVALAAPCAAAEPRVCSEDLAKVEFGRGGPFAPAPDELKRSLLPALQQLQRDLCRCLPEDATHWPPTAKAQVQVDPNEGTARLTYRLPPPWSDRRAALIECMGSPSVAFEPYRYVSDMIVDGRAAPATFTAPVELVVVSSPDD